MSRTTDLKPTDRTWETRKAARRWLANNPQDGLGVDYNLARKAYVLRPQADIDADQNVPMEAPDTVVGADDSWIADLANVHLADDPSRMTPDFAKEPDMPRKRKAPAAPSFGALIEGGNANPPVPTATVIETIKASLPPDPTGGALCRDVRLVITGLPEASSAYTWAKDLCKKLGLPIEVTGPSGDVVATIDAAHLATVKAAIGAMRTTTKSAGAPRASGPGPSSQKMIDLCMRSEGASAAELAEATGWKLKGPWGTDLRKVAHRWGCTLDVQDEDAGKSRRFYMTRPETAAAA